jgi:LruC domain-containing protein
LFNIKSLVLGVALSLSGSVLAKSVEDRTDAMFEHTEHHQLAASFNIEGGYRTVKGQSTWVPPIYTGAESFTIDGVTNTVNQWYVLADAKYYMAHQLYTAGNFQAALDTAEEAKDIYDALNNNVGQTIGFWKVNQMTQVSFPAMGYATVAYEDLFPYEGDADYNDLVVNMRITENYNRNDELISIRMDYVPRARGAGYNHEFQMIVDGEVDQDTNISLRSAPVFNGEGYATVRRFGVNGLEVSRDTYTDGADLVIFPDTRTALPAAPGTFASNTIGGKCMTTPQVTSRVNIVITDPANNKLQDRQVVGVPNYRPVLHVKNTNQDIDVVDVNSNIIQNGDGGMTPDGYPFGIVVPVNWQWPMEYQHIELGYPLFAQYRQYLLTGETPADPKVLEWYNHPAANAADYVFAESKFTGVCE